MKNQVNVDCFFTTEINLAYKTSFSEGERIRHRTAFQWFFCSNYYSRKNVREKHLQHCTGRPRFVYNFNTRSLLTFEENLKYKTDIALTAYTDFETTAPTDDCLDPEKRRIFAVSYAIIFAFHPKLSIDRIIIERSFGHSLAQLCSLDYLTNEQLKFKDLTILKQLRHCAFLVASKNKKIAISEMFTTELKFARSCLMKWFNAKFKSQNVVLSNDIKIKYQSENPIDWRSGRCCICTFPIEINPTMSDATKNTMSYSNFVIHKEHKFLRNIFSEEELSTSVALKDFPTYHKNFSRVLRIAIYLQNSLIRIQEFSDCVYDELIDFCSELCKDCENFLEIKETISAVEIKNAPQSKIPKSTLQIYAFFYQRIMGFPHCKFDYETLTTSDLFIYAHKIINVKIHLHHSHVTGKILGYAHDFCNEKVRENKDIFSCVEQNFFRFDIYFLLKGTRVSVWDTQEINIGGSGLTTIKIASLDDVKLIDTMKYFLTSLERLAATLDPIERERVETAHSYFSRVWKELTDCFFFFFFFFYALYFNLA